MKILKPVTDRFRIIVFISKIFSIIIKKLRTNNKQLRAQVNDLRLENVKLINKQTTEVKYYES
jgi:hypothetical protein